MCTHLCTGAYDYMYSVNMYARAHTALTHFEHIQKWKGHGRGIFSPRVGTWSLPANRPPPSSPASTFFFFFFPLPLGAHWVFKGLWEKQPAYLRLLAFPNRAHPSCGAARPLHPSSSALPRPARPPAPPPATPRASCHFTSLVHRTLQR